MAGGNVADRNKRTLTVILLVVAGMVCLSFAAVPLYKVFCRVTGFGGTTQVSERAPDENQILKRTVEIRFNADVGRNMLWSFRPDKRLVNVQLGQQGLVTFTARNKDRVPVTGVAAYNVTPSKAGKYFHKIQCFCFGEQSLNPGESATYPVIFFVDPSMDKDPNMVDVTSITLSYTFFQKDAPELETAMENLGKEDDATSGPKSLADDPQALSGTVALPPEKQ